MSNALETQPVNPAKILRPSQLIRLAKSETEKLRKDNPEAKQVHPNDLRKAKGWPLPTRLIAVQLGPLKGDAGYPVEHIEAVDEPEALAKYIKMHSVNDHRDRPRTIVIIEE